MNNMKMKMLGILLLLVIVQTKAQQLLTMQEAIELALKNNLQIKADEYSVKSFEELRKTHSDIGKTNFAWMNGQYNSQNRDNNFTISQTIPFPTTIAQQLKLGKAQVEVSRLNLSVTRNELIYQVSSLWVHLSYLVSMHDLLLSQDSLYSGFVRASELRFKTGESNLLERTSAETQMQEIRNQLAQNKADIFIYEIQLQTLMNSADSIGIKGRLSKLRVPESRVSTDMNPTLLYSKQEVVLNRQTRRVERSRLLPDITIGYFNQSLIGFQRVGSDEVYFDRSKKFTGFQLGLAIPIWFVPQAGRAKAAHFNEAAAQKKYEYTELNLKSTLINAYKELEKNALSLEYYERNALKNASLILRQSDNAYRNGEIGYLEYLLAVKNAHALRTNYLLSLHQYNQSILRIYYLRGEN